jgi:ferric-dicitrate binding protein FerR (iron transport regulator)
MCGQREAIEELDREAMSRLFDLIDAEDVTSVLLELYIWLREDSAHCRAWARALRISRLMVSFLRVTEPGDSTECMDAFVDVIDGELRLPGKSGGV